MNKTPNRTEALALVVGDTVVHENHACTISAIATGPDTRAMNPAQKAHTEYMYPAFYLHCAVPGCRKLHALGYLFGYHLVTLPEATS